MRDLLEAQTERNFGYGPRSLTEQHTRFLEHTGADHFRCRLAGDFLQYLVQVIYVQCEAVGKITGCSKLHGLRRVFNRKLSLKQLNKQREYPRRRIAGSWGDGERMKLLPLVNKFYEVCPQQVMLIRVIAVNFLVHLLKDGLHLGILFIRDVENKITLRREDGQFVQGDTCVGTRHKFSSKYTKVARLVIVKRPVAIGYLGRGKEYSLPFDVHRFVRILDLVTTSDETDFVIRAAVVRHGSLGLTTIVHRLEIKHIKMTNVAARLVVKKKVKFRTFGAECLLIKFMDRNGSHGLVEVWAID